MPAILANAFHADTMFAMAVRWVDGMPGFRLCVLVFLLVFLALCGIHLLGPHHDPHNDEIGPATAVAMLLATGGLTQALCRERFEGSELDAGFWSPLRLPCGPPIRAPIRT